MIKCFSNFFLRILGWRVISSEITQNKFIIIGAPHTSNWDFPLSLLALSALGMKFSWIGKHTLFRSPFKTFFQYLGGIPVDRSIRLSFIENMIQLFSEKEGMKLAIAPEGTRSKKDHWKTGFYYIAVAANVPIVMAYIDYSKKELGIGPTLTPTGDLEADFAIISAFYMDKTGKFPERQSVIRIRKRELQRIKKQHQ